MFPQCPSLRSVLAVAVWLACGGASPVGAQLGGTVHAPDGSPLPYANVLLLALPDSNFLAGATTDEAGRFTLEASPSGTALMRAVALGYRDAYLPVDPATTTYAFHLQAAGTALETVTVTGKKRLYEIKPDRTVMNVSATPALSGTTALQVLQRAPGVIVDQQNNTIGMNARGEILVMINDRVQRVPAAVLLQQLAGMPAENIERIELIHQPGARYDAGGAAGIINIVLKTDERQGVNGSYSLTAGYGQREKLLGSLDFNARHGTTNWYGGYQGTHGRSDRNQVDHFREYDYQGRAYAYENFLTLADRREGNHAVNLGLDLSPTSSTTIGLRGSFARSVSEITNARSISRSFTDGQPTGELDYLVSGTTRIRNFFANANLVQRIGGGGQLTADLDLVGLHFDNRTHTRPADAGPEGGIRAERITPVKIYTGRLDYERPLGNGARLETGIKGTFSDIASDAIVRNTADEEWEISRQFTGTDRIDERILAAYAAYHQDFSPRLSGELGFRFEHFDSRIDARRPADDNRQTFNNPFPVLRFNYTLDSLNTLQFGFNRAIARPSFWNLASFFVFLDPTIFGSSNPALRPAFTSNLRLAWQHRSGILSLTYLDTRNNWFYYNTVDKANHVQTVTPSNLEVSRAAEASLVLPVTPGAGWDVNATLTALYHRIEDRTGRELPFTNDLVTYTVQLNTNLDLGGGWSASADGRYMSDFLLGDQVQRPSPFVNLGLRKQFPSGATLSLAVMDLTNSIALLDWEYHQPGVGIRTFGQVNWSERQVRLTYSSTFGNAQLQAKRERTSAAEDIRQRL